MRIVSFLPSATELAFSLGLGDDVVGVSHECDYPPEAKTRPAVVHCAIPLDGLGPAEIDSAVGTQLRVGGSIYTVDADLLRALEPDVILAQDLCEVCAPSGNETERALAALDGKAKVLTLAPRSLREIHENLRDLAELTDRVDIAKTLIAEDNERLARLVAELQGAQRRRVFFLEWIDPIFCGGHWVPEMIELAGGFDALGRKGGDSVRIDRQDVLRWAPEMVVISPCGAHLDSAIEQGSAFLSDPYWSTLPAVESGEVYAVDASSYFARPGPRVFDGIDVLAHLFHPERVPERMPGASCRITVSEAAQRAGRRAALSS
jgi:iron complex transport system substrate-binding protein